MELKHIGRYDIKSLIGQGGMSAVYLAYDPRSKREVAIKILPPYYLHAPKFRERFDREALMIALLEHPAIVPVYDMGEEDGQPYIVMRYMSGGSLAERLRQGPIPLRECLDMYIRLAPALDTAHARGVTHRDVKPDNLLFDKYNNVFLSDFGLARLRETIGFANISDGSILGTPAYMSPEQIQGDREIDGRSDIYSMGVVLYHMLCGNVPFTGTTAASVMMKHLINPVPQIREQNKSLPTAIQSVLDIAMAKDPKDRYQTAGEFAKAFQAVITGVHKKPSVQHIGNTPPMLPGKRARRFFSAKQSDASLEQPDLPSTLPAHETAMISLPQDELIRNHVSSGSILSVTARQERGPLRFFASLVDRMRLNRLHIPLWGWLLSVVIVFIFSLTVVQWFRGGTPFSPSPLSHRDSQGNSTSPILGQADMLAFLKGQNIWISNLDGSGLNQLTTDGMKKSHLIWSPDGKSILYTTENCLYTIGLEEKQAHSLTCFSGVTKITAFDISPDGSDVALGLDQTDLYLLPFNQIFKLRPNSFSEDLLSLAQCSYYAPYEVLDTLKAVDWSLTKDHLALLTSKSVDGIDQDEINILDFSQCSAFPPLVKEIPPTYLLFSLRGYYDRPEISSISWNRHNQLLMSGFLNNDGFGDLQLYDLDQNQGQEITPNGACCYRDTFWSPDGTYLFYTFQPEAGGEISLFYTAYPEKNQPGNTVSLAFPAGFFTNKVESLQPALRAVH